ncbi:MAG TPA: D-alanine--D-alanine ligase, partial [Streptosporangiaceae bacterium]|nr:D-alanine--D-alanine ligase [Streptosporangiaceae bacterium]
MESSAGPGGLPPQSPRGRRIRVAVVFGGRGPEHAISCLGGGNVLRVIDRDRYEVIPIGITTEGAWLQVTDDPAKLAIADGELPTVESVAKPDAHVVPWAYQGDSPVVASAPGHIPHVLGDVDLVLPVLHGPYGEDGTIQGLLELAGVPYVGAGVLASAVSMDKEYMKLVFAARGLPICPYVVVRDRDWQGGPGVSATAERKRIYDATAELGYPVFVKPARGGSSIGTSKAADQAALIEAIEGARRYDSKVIVERAVDGAE